MESSIVKIKPGLCKEIDNLIKKEDITDSVEDFVNSAVRNYLIEYRAKKIRRRTKPLISKLKKREYVPKPITRKEKIKTAENYLKEKGLGYEDLS